MKQFVNGNDAQFHSLYEQISDGDKKVWFTVCFPKSTRARLAFRCVNGQIVLELAPYGEASFPTYNGSNEFLRRLIADRGATFNSIEQVQEAFCSARSDYNPPDRVRTLHRAVQGENSERIVHIPTVLDPIELASDIKSQIIGQDIQVDGICKSVCNHLRKKSPKKPLVIMLPGPTGVGKTATARRLAECLQERFGEGAFPLISVNCNEFRESYRISQLTGSPQGYVGHDESCMMSVASKTGRFVLLLDEYEKLNSEISVAIMQWMDTGKITLSRIEDGKENAEYDCRGSIFILTSNIEMRETAISPLRFAVRRADGLVPHESVTESTDDRCRRVMVNNGFKPEVAGRISRFFEFKSLSQEDITQIALLVFKNKISEYGFIVDDIKQELVDDIKSHYTSNDFGVRPLENALDEVLGSQLPAPSDCEQHIEVGGTIKHLVITEV